MSEIKKDINILQTDINKLCEHLNKTFINWHLKEMAARIKKSADSLEGEIDKIAEILMPPNFKKDKLMEVIIDGVDDKREIKKEMVLIKKMIIELGNKCRSVLINPIRIDTFENLLFGEAIYSFYEIETRRVFKFFEKNKKKKFLKIYYYVRRDKIILDCGYKGNDVLSAVKPILIRYGEELNVDKLMIGEAKF